MWFAVCVLVEFDWHTFSQPPWRPVFCFALLHLGRLLRMARCSDDQLLLRLCQISGHLHQLHHLRLGRLSVLPQTQSKSTSQGSVVLCSDGPILQFGTFIHVAGTLTSTQINVIRQYLCFAYNISCT